jgi:MFS family permease
VPSRALGAVALVLCVALVLAMAGTMTFQALIPTFIAEWQLSHAEAGWISGAAYAGYMAGVPFLVTLTDRIDGRRIVIAFALVASLSSLGFALLADGLWSAVVFRMLNGLALAGTYMPGLKALTDRVEGPRASRYQSLYTATFSVGTGLSLLQAGLVGDWLGWRPAFAVAGIAPLLAALLVGWRVQPLSPAAPERIPERLFDVRPVLRNREAIGYVLGYGAHTWELFGFRTWLVAFMAFAAASQGGGVSDSTISIWATAILMLGLPASVLGNELATRIGRRRVLTLFMLVSAAFAASLGFAAALPFWLTVAVLALYSATVMTDSASLTVGAVNAAAAERRGITMAVHSTVGSLTAFLSPLASGLALDLSGGGTTALSWVACFATLGAGVALGPLALAWLVGAGRAGSVDRRVSDASGDA